MHRKKTPTLAAQTVCHSKREISKNMSSLMSSSTSSCTLSNSESGNQSQSRTRRSRSKNRSTRQTSITNKQRVRSTDRGSNRSPSPCRYGAPKYVYKSQSPRNARLRPKSAETFKAKYLVGSQGRLKRCRSRSRPFSANVARKNVLNRWYNKDTPRRLREGEVFSPILWRKFHIDEHLFDIPTENELSKQEMKDNLQKIMLKYPHLTKEQGLNGMTSHREKVLSEGYHRISRVDASEDNSNQKHLWQRHVEMMKVSKSTSYYNFLSHFDRQSCRACSHSNICSSKHCSSCKSGTKCEKHSINIDFLKYIPDHIHESKNKHHDRKNGKVNGKEEADIKLKIDHVNKKTTTTISKKPSQQSLNVTNVSHRGYTMQGFTIMRKTPEMERKTLLSQHIEGKQCGSGNSSGGVGKSSNKKCLACAFAKENVLMQKLRPPDLQAPFLRGGRRMSKKYTQNLQPNVLY